MLIRNNSLYYQQVTNTFFPPPNLEPGFYEAGKFGCRIEDIVRIVPANVPYNFEARTYLKFETVSLVPIQTKMLVPEMLTSSEVSLL